MSTKNALAAAVLFAALAGPALAQGRPTSTHVVRPVPANAYASAVTAPAPLSSLYQNDFQLQGRF